MSRPDTALRRSDELLAVGQPAAALASVYEIIASGKRFRSTPLSSLEPIMFRYLDLCVDLRKGKHAREGLHTYKNAAQNTSVTAVETVIRHFLDKSKAKLDEALAKVDEVAGPETGGTTTSTQMTKEDGSIQTVEVEDLEEAETPESILLSTVSDEKSRDRTYRTLVTPWLRFLWEAYRTALDTLRNNTRLEVLYQQVALEAFQFCLTHNRKTEFRRLCETLRQHFAYTQKYSSQTYAINISDPETLQRYLDIRFAQLNTAVELELWQEAFRSAEDIHGLVAVSKRAPRASMMASFYEKLVKVFAVGQNFLFHAAAYGKLWSLQAATSSHDNQGSDRIAGLVLLSALSVPISHAHERKVRRDPITGEEKDYTKGRMTLMGLLDLPYAPSRETLLRDARTALKYVSPELRQLYQIIEVDFHPLHITSKLEPIFAHLQSNPDTQRYVEPLKSVVLSRIFQQLAQVYDSVKLARVIKLATFKDDVNEEGFDAAKVRIEKFITAACIRGEMSVRLDHLEGIIEFEDKMFEMNEINDGGDDAGSTVDVLQPTPSTLLRTHLTHLAQTLFVSLDTISPSTSALAQAKHNAEAALQAMAANLEKDRDALLSRRLIADQRKQRAEQEAAAREREAEAARAAARAQQAANEARRVEQEAKAKQLEMIKRNNEAVKAEEARKLADKLKSIGALKVSDKEIDNLDTAALMRIQVEKMEKDKRDMAEKLRIISKRIDHTERAFRKEEVPLLHKDYELQQKRDREVFEQSKATRLEDAKNAHAARLALKKKLSPMVTDIESFKEKRMQATSALYQKKVQEAQAKIAEEKAARKAAVEKRRREIEEERKRQEEERQRQEEEERRRQEEEARRAEEERLAREAEEARLAEEKKKQEEELARRRAERDAERAKADEVFRKQREREAEIERKLAEKEAARKAGATRAVPGAREWRREEPGAAPAAAATSSAGPPKIPGVQPGYWRARAAAQGTSASGSASPSVVSPPDSRSATPSGAGERRPLSLQPRSTPAGAGGSWRDREAAKASTNGPAPAARPQEQTNGGDDGFETVAPKKPAGGAYRPPGRR